MELQLIKLLFYGFIITAVSLVVYITVLVLLLNNKIERIKENRKSTME